MVGTIYKVNQVTSIKLSDNFWLSEFTKSNTATRLGIDNTPSQGVIDNLEFLCVRILQPTRDHFVRDLKRARSMKITSGFRCLELNRELRSDDTSQHLTGEAADCEILGVDNYEVACWIRDNLEFDQLILEFYTGEPNSGWIHVSCKEQGHNRQECLTITKGLVRSGLIK